MEQRFKPHTEEMAEKSRDAFRRPQRRYPNLRKDPEYPTKHSQFDNLYTSRGRHGQRNGAIVASILLLTALGLGAKNIFDSFNDHDGQAKVVFTTPQPEQPQVTVTPLVPHNR